MNWVHEARNKVVKKGGLASSSFARVRLVSSYFRADERTFEFPPDIATGALIATAVRGVPQEKLGFSLLEIERHWEAADLQGEILGRLAEAIGKCSVLLEDLARRLNGHPSLGKPDDLIKNATRPECADGWEPETVRLNPLDGSEYQVQSVVSPLNEDTVSASAKRYGLEKLALRPPYGARDDPIEFATVILPIARRLMEKDGHHLPMVFLHHPTDGWSPPRIVDAQDKLDKYLLWREIGKEVEVNGYDGLVAIAEVWMAQLPDEIVTPYLDLSKQPGRQEALVVYGASEDGRISVMSSMIWRRLGKVRLSEPRALDYSTVGFMQPVFRAWAWPAIDGPLVGPPPPRMDV